MRSHAHDEPTGARDKPARPARGDSIDRRHASDRLGPDRAGAGRIPASAAITKTSVMALQGSAGNALVARLLAGEGVAGRRLELQRSEERSPVFDVIRRGGGRALDGRVRETMEDHLGTQLDSVRVHVDARSTESVQAKAYTVGEDIVVHPRHFNTSSSAGRELLAHEAVHVAQQRSGPVSGTPVGGGISLSDPSDRFEREAEATARDVRARL